MAEALVLSASSGEEAEADKGKAGGPQRSRRISQAPVDSDDSGPELEKRDDVQEQLQKEGRGVKLNKEQKKREKSQRHREKKEKRSKAVEKLKKDRFSDVSGVGETWFSFHSFVFLASLSDLQQVNIENGLIKLHLMQESM